MYMSAFGENDQENDSRSVSSGPSRCWKWIWLPTPFLVGWNSQVWCSLLPWAKHCPYSTVRAKTPRAHGTAFLFLVLHVQQTTTVSTAHNQHSTIACSTVELARYLLCPRKNASQYILAGTSASVLLVHSIDLPSLQLHNHSSRPWGASCVTKIKKLLQNTENYSLSSLLVSTDGIKRVLIFRCRAREIEFFHQYIRILLH